MSRSSQATDQKQREKSSFYDVLVNRKYFIFIFPSIFDKTLFSINKINVLKYFQKVLKDFFVILLIPTSYTKTKQKLFELIVYYINNELFSRSVQLDEY